MADAREEKLKNARLKLEQFRNKKKSKPGGLTSTVKVSIEGAENTQLNREIQAPQTERSKVDTKLGSCSTNVNQPEESIKNEQEQVVPFINIAVINSVSQLKESCTIEEQEQEDSILSEDATNIINPPEESTIDEQDQADATVGIDDIDNVIQPEDFIVEEKEQVDSTLSIAVTNITSQPEGSTNEEDQVDSTQCNAVTNITNQKEDSTIEEQEQEDYILSEAATNIINPPEESTMDEQDHADATVGIDNIENVIQPEDSIVEEKEQVDSTLSIAVTSITSQPEESTNEEDQVDFTQCNAVTNITNQKEDSTIQEQDYVDPTFNDAVTIYSNQTEESSKDGQAQGDDKFNIFCTNNANKIEKCEEEHFQNNGNQVEIPLKNEQTQMDDTLITPGFDNANEVEKDENEPMQDDGNLNTSCSNNGSQVDKLEDEELKIEKNLNIHCSNHGSFIFKPVDDYVQQVIANEDSMNSGSVSVPISVNQEESKSMQSDDPYIPNKGDYVECLSEEANVCSESEENIQEDLGNFLDESSKKEIVSCNKNKEELSCAFHEENQASHSTENLNISSVGDLTVNNDAKFLNISNSSKEKLAKYTTEYENDLLDDELEKEYVFVENSGGINKGFDPEGKNIQKKDYPSAENDSECDAAVFESELVLKDEAIEENKPIESKNIISESITLDIQTTEKSPNDYIDVPKDDMENNCVEKIKNAIIDSVESLKSEEVITSEEQNENVTKEEVLSQSKIATENEENALKFIKDANAYDIKALTLKKDISQCNATQENYHLEINQLEERNRQLCELLEQEKINKEQLATEVVNKTNQLDNLKEAMLAKMKEVYQTHFKEKSELEKNITDTEKKFSDQLDSLSSQVIMLSTEKIEMEKNNLLSTNQLAAQFEENSIKLNDKLKQKDEECHHLHLKMESVQNEHLQVKHELSALNSQYISLLQESGTQQLLNEKDLVISSLRKELLLAKKVFNELSEEKTNLINERNQLANQYSSYSKDLASHTEKLSEHLRRFQGENARLVQRERALLDHLAVLEAKILSPNGPDGNVKGEFFLLKEKCLTLEGQMKGTAEENGALKKKISEHIAEARKAKISNDGELQSLKHKLEIKERRVQDLEAHIKQVEISNCLNIEKLEKSMEDQNQQIVNLESQLKRKMDEEDDKEFQSKGTIKEQKILELDDLSEFRNEEKKEFVSNSATTFQDKLSQKDIDSNGQFGMIQSKPIEEVDIMTEVYHNDEFESSGNSVDDQKELFDEIKNTDKDDEICKEVENELKLAMERVGQLTTEKAHLEELVTDLQEETEIIGDYITIYQNQRKQQKGKLEEKDRQLQRMEKEKQRLTGSILHMQQLMMEAGVWKRLEAGIDLMDQVVTNNEDDSDHRRDHEFEPWLWQPSAGKVLTV